jgi:hypothetical protein
LNIATDGLIDDVTSLTIATRGLIQPEVVEDVKIILPPAERRGGVGTRGPTIYVRKKPERLEPYYDIHRDDQEVLEILIQAILSGILD